LNVRNFINCIPKKDTINTALKNIDLLTHAWEAESLTQIILIFQYYNDDTSLKEIIDDLKKHIN